MQRYCFFLICAIPADILPTRLFPIVSDCLIRFAQARAIGYILKQKKALCYHSQRGHIKITRLSCVLQGLRVILLIAIADNLPTLPKKELILHNFASNATESKRHIFYYLSEKVAAEQKKTAVPYFSRVPICVRV